MFASQLKINEILSIATVIIIVLALVICVSFALQLKFLLFFSLSLLLLIPSISLFLKYPDFIIFMGLFLNFSPVNRNIGFYPILLLTIVLAVDALICKKKFIKWDIITLLWILLGIIAIATIPKWISNFRGIKGTLYLVVIPFCIYTLVNSNYLSEKMIVRFFTRYFPILFFYVVIQMLLIVISGSAVSGSTYMHFHTGFRLAWGGTVFLAALILFFSFLAVFTKHYWGKSPLISALNYFNIMISMVFLILIMARAPIVSMILSLIIFIAFKNYYYKSFIKIRPSYFIYTGIIATIIYFIFYGFVNNLIDRFVHMKIDSSFLLRLYLYYTGMKVFIQNILIGLGPDQYLYNDFYKYVTDPNNIFLSYAVAFGIGGLIIIIIIFSMPFIKLVNIDNKSINVRYFGVSLIPVLLLAIFNSCLEVIITSFSYGMLFWTVYAIYFRTYKTTIS